MALTAEQLAYRRSGIGSSDVAAILGLSNYRKPIDVYADKRGLTEPQPESPAMRAGTRIEPLTAQYFQEVTGAAIMLPTTYVATCQRTDAAKDFGPAAEKLGIFQHPQYPEFMASPDRIAIFTDHEAILELKFARSRNAGKWGEQGSEEYPLDYLAQVQWQLFVCGFDVAYLAVLIGGEDFRHYRIERDEELIAMMADKALDFWHNHVVPGIPPVTVDDSKAWREIAKRPEKGRAIQATVEIEELRREYLAAKAELDAADSKLETVKNKIIVSLAGAERVNGDDWTISYQEREGRTSTDWKGLAKELAIPAETLTRFQQTGKPSRVLTIK